MEQPDKKTATIFVLDLDAEGSRALRAAQEIAAKTGRDIEVRDADGNLIGIARPTRH